MGEAIRSRIADLLLSNKRHARYMGALALMAAIVALGVPLGLRQHGVAMAHEETVLDCHYSGKAAHTHDASCYDADGNLVCPLPEREAHVHDDSCYTETRTLVCGQEENAGHQHDDSCYDEEGNLFCGLEEGEGAHVHDDSCYQVTRELTCGREEVTETHVHGPGCFRTVVVQDDDEPQMPAQKFSGVLKVREEDGTERVYLKVKVEAPEGALPANTTMVVDHLKDEDTEALTKMAEEAVDRQVAKDYPDVTAKAKLQQMTGVDIAFVDEWGNDVEPAEKLTVRITTRLVRDAESPVLVQVVDKQKTGKAEDAEVVDPVWLVNEDKKDTSTGNENTLQFEGDSFSLVGAKGAYPFVVAEVEFVEPEGEEATDNVQLVGDGPAKGTEDADVPMPKQSFKDEVDGVTVEVSAPKGALAEGTTMKVAAVDVDEFLESASSAVEGDVVDAVAVDITFQDAEGNKVQPKVPIKVTMIDAGAPAQGEPVVVHVDDKGTAGVVEQSAAASGDGQVTFDAKSFSVYGIVYTVDSQEETDEKAYEFSLPESGFVSLRELVTTLGMVDDANGEASDAEVDVADDADGETSDTAVDEFIADVVSAKFSDQDLVWVGKTEEETTVGALKEANGLECDLPATLTSEQIEAIDATVVKSGDWALISLKDFDTEETLAITMKNGDVYVVKVTGYEASSNVLTAKGETYTITVSYDDSAGIPRGTKLVASEIESGTDEYNQHLGQVWTEVNDEYFEVEEKRENYDESMGELPDAHYVNISAARFFDIKLVHDGETVEPKTPVQVEISYEQGLEAPGQMTPGLALYDQKDQVEIVEDAEMTVRDDVVTSFRYEQESLTEVGTYVEQETQDIYVEPSLAAAPDPNGSAAAPTAGLTDEALDEVIRSATTSRGPLRAGEGEQSDENDNTGLDRPEAHKSLTPNTDENDQEDGTYTLTLSVKGHSSVTTETTVKKANVLVVMDRSSSMITKTVSNETIRWYYGTRNTSSWRGDVDESHGYHFIGVVDGQDVDLNVNFNGTWDNPTLTYRSGTDGWGNPQYSPYPDDAPIYVESKKTRMTAEQEALSTLFTQLMDNNDASGANRDIVEISVISFADERYDDKSWANETEVGWQSGRDTSTLMGAVSSNRYTSGTNWEEALQYAYSVISAKKAQDGAAEDYYVIFLTDGEPTAVEGESGSAYHTGSGSNGNIYAYNAAKDDAKNIVDGGFGFYNIFTFRQTEDETYSIYLTNYAYGNGDYNASTTPAVEEYYEDAQTIDSLTDKFNDIFNTIEDSIGHGNVSITDTLTTDAMTTTVVHGKTNGYVYTVKDPSENTLYTVTATGDLDDPTVTFNVPGSATEEYTAHASTVGGKTVYSVTTDEGKVYKMALADIDDATGELVWDLSPVGLLLDNCTYSVDFVVWPDQDAYDYVAGLNNNLPGYTWDTSASTYQDLTDTKGYAKGGVPQYPSIVRYPDGTFAVLTNSDQQLHYSVIETKTTNGTSSTEITGPFYHDLELPEPMPLTKTESHIEKQWNVERDPGILAQLLYDRDGNPTEYAIDFRVLQDDDGTTDEDDEANTYTTVHLGWDEDQNKYLWEADSERTVIYSGHQCVVGTRWATSFSIATGLMLSDERMDALGLDKTAYPSGEFEGTTYYILEEGHDFTIQEPGLTYEFDFSGPTYHPMIVDGVMRSVDVAYEKDDDGAITAVDITGMSSADVDLSSLKIQNTLRGYINLDKVVVKPDGTTPAPDDKSKFTYDIILENDTDPGPFTIEGSHVPWYGISGLFYHTIGDDGQYHYFQAYPAGEGHVTLTDEDGNTYDATCEGTFAESVGPEAITYTDSTGTEQTIQLYGNQMDRTSDNYVSATIQIAQGQTLNIANVPAGTQYTITEAGKAGYEFVNVVREIKVSPDAEAESSMTVDDSSTITGTIVANRDNHVTYKNKQLITSLDVEKVWKDSEGNTVDGSGLSDVLADDASIDVTLKRYKMVEKTGTLTINQSLTDSTEGHDFNPSGLTVEYTLTDESNVVVYAGTYTGTTGAEIPGLKLGKTYTLTVHNSAAGYNVDPTDGTSVIQMTSESVEENLSAEITDLPPEYGSIVIRQTVTGTAASVGGDSWVTNYVIKQNGTTVQSGSYTGIVNYEVLNLPVGSGYSVEITNSTTNDSYAVGTTAVQTVSDLTVEKDGRTPAVFTNTLNKRVGFIAINQTLEGSGASEGASSYTVIYTVKKGAETVASGSYTGTAGATINNLEIGDDYTVTLSCSGGSYEGSDFVGSKEWTGVSVAEGEYTSLDFTNTLENSVPHTVTIHGDEKWNNVYTRSVSYQYAHGTTVTVSFTGGNQWWNPYSGNQYFMLGSTNMGAITQNSSFTFTVNSDLDITITNTGNSNWDNTCGSNMHFSPEPTRNAQAPAANVSMRTSAPTLRSVPTRNVSLRAEGDGADQTSTTQDLIVSNDGTVPTMEYYTLEIDTSFNNNTGSMTIHLPDNGSWKKTVENLAKTDENGNPYVYFIEKVEEHNVPTGTVASIDKDGTVQQVVYGDYDEEGTISDNDTLGVTDVLPEQVGNLKITKDLLGDLQDTEDSTVLSKEYRVTIKNSAGEYLQSDGTFSETEVVHTVSASTQLEFTGIPIGTYTVSEKTGEGDVAIEGFLYNVEESTTTGTGEVTFLQTATVELKNYYDGVYVPVPSDTDETTDLVIDKSWVKADGSTTPADTDTIKFKVKVKSADAYVPVDWELYDGNGTLNESLSGIYYVQNGAVVTFTFDRYEQDKNTPGTSYWLNTNVPLTTQAGLVISPRNVIPHTGNGSGVWNQDGQRTTFTTEAIDGRVLVLAQPYGSDAKWVTTPSANGERSWSVAVTGGSYFTTVADMREALIDENATVESLVYTLDSTGVTIDEENTSCNIRPESATAENWTATLAGLPTYQLIEDEEGNQSYKVYSYEIDEIEVNGITVTDSRTDDYIVSTSTTGDTTEITNTEIKKVSADATKAWLNADETTTPPDGASVTFELFADGTATGKTVVLDGVTREQEINADESLSEEEKAAAIAALAEEESGEFEAWKAEWRNLPQYSDDAQTVPIEYTVKETSGYTGYTNQNPDGVPSRGTICNKQDTYDFDILKVKAGTANPLSGASFTIQKIKETSDTSSVQYDSNVVKTCDPSPTGDDGKTGFTGIAPGYYEVVETQTPEGYVLTGDAAFYVKVEVGGTIKLLKKVVGESSVTYEEVADDTQSGNVTLSTAYSTVTFIVENEPGASLPNAGGPGTALTTMLGIMLVALSAAALLLMRRPSRANAGDMPGVGQGRPLR